MFVTTDEVCDMIIDKYTLAELVEAMGWSYDDFDWHSVRELVERDFAKVYKVLGIEGDPWED